MINAILHTIEWDTEGMRAKEDCRLPATVLAINVPPPHTLGEEDMLDFLGILLEETYGFKNSGFLYNAIKLDAPGCRMMIHPDAIMDATHRKINLVPSPIS